MMEALIPILDRAPGGARYGVDARELHRALGVGRDFSTWIRERVETFGLVLGTDFEVFHAAVENPSGGRPRIEYVVTLDAAKHLALAERNEAGRRVRTYFIECERRLREQAPAALPAPDLRDPMTAVALLAQSLQVLQEEQERCRVLQAENAELAPKAATFDRCMSAEGTYGFRETCKILERSHGVTERDVRAVLFQAGLVQRLGRRMQPTYRGQSRGLVTARARLWTDDFGVDHPKPELRITAKGIAWLDQRFAAERAA